jgi:hypothetical protein
MLNPLHIEKLVVDVMFFLHKGVLKWSMNNPNSRVSQNQNIVEYLTQSPHDMYTLDVLVFFTSNRYFCIGLSV